MTKTLKIAFTGNAVLTPPYPDNLGPIQQKLYAVMPGARRVRQSDLRPDQINAQFAFLKFPYRHLVVTEDDDRDADYKYPDTRDTTTGLCFLEREHLFIEQPPHEQTLTFDSSPATGTPTTSSTGVGWIARWRDFAATGNSGLKRDILNVAGDYSRVQIDAGHVSSGFISEPIARIDFDYGDDPPTRSYAQEIVVTLTYDDSTPYVTLRSAPFKPFPGGSAEPSALRFDWYDAPEIKILFGNGSLSSILNALKEPPLAGNDHDGDYDIEFEVLYDIINIQPDSQNRLPLPRIISNEILRVPCVASMIDLISPEGTAATTTADVTTTAIASKDARRQPRAVRAQRRKP